MPKYESLSIEKLVEKIEKEEVILPAMQRNFVWAESKIADLFDSLLREYPIGTFLFWNVESEEYNKYVFNTFIKDYDEKKGKTQRGERATIQRSEYSAVLDGQQRITSLYMGLKGKYRTHKKGMPKDKDTSYFDRFFCVNILHVPSDVDEKYLFAFKKTEEIEQIIRNEEDTEDEYWIEVSKVCESDFDPMMYFFKKGFMDIWSPETLMAARELMNKLREVICVQENISYYKAEKKNLSQVVEIFVRVNNGGQKLVASDLMLSVATSKKGDVDFQLAMDDAVETISNAAQNEDTSFQADKELVLTAGLMFTGAENLSLQKEESYSQERIGTILDNWEDIVAALCNASRYIEYLGFNGKKLTSKNLLLPVAYYFYLNQLTDNHKLSNCKRAQCDRVFIRQWMLRTMINSVFSDSTRTTLLRMRNLIAASSAKYFPLDELMLEEIRKPLTIGHEQIEDILAFKYGDGRILPLLSELAKVTGAKMDIDHIFPRSKLVSVKERKKYASNLTDAEMAKLKDNCDYIANLELLEHVVNIEKSDRLYDEWLSNVHPDPADSYYERNCIPKCDTYEFESFLDFMEKRRRLLAERLVKTFPEDFDDIVKRNGLVL